MSNRSEKILVRGVNWVGDAVMTTPALLRLREARSGATIALLTPAKLAGLWTRHPAVDQIIAFAPKDSVLSVARRLRRERFGTALILPNSPRAALESWLAGIPQRVGTARPWRNWFLTQAVAPRADEIRMHKRTPAEVQALIERALAGSPKADEKPLPARAHHLFQYLHLAAALGADPAPVAPLV